MAADENWSLGILDVLLGMVLGCFLSRFFMSLERVPFSDGEDLRWNEPLHGRNQ